MLFLIFECQLEMAIIRRLLLYIYITNRYNEIWDYNYCHGEKNFNRPGHEGHGTHCNSDSGACVDGKCISMQPYVAPKQPAPPGNF